MGKYAKAIGGGIAAAIGSLLLVMSGNETLADVTQVEWMVVALNVLGTYGIVYGLKNQPPGDHEA